MKKIQSFIIAFSFLLTVSVTSCNYDVDIEDAEVTVILSEPLGMVTVDIMNSIGRTFSAVTDSQGVARVRLAPGLYSISASFTNDDGYIRTAINGAKSDIVVSGNVTTVFLTVVRSTITLENPVLIKEIYVGGCQKDDGSGFFANDKCIVLYNNSSQPASLDDIAFGIVEPYNAESSLHSFLTDGKLDYENQDWIPAINGIWYFQPGHSIAPYSELVVNVYGCIDNTVTYRESINYANPEYFTMYDVEAAGSDGGKYNNTSYYPSPSEVIPTSHYLRAVKFGQGNAWPISMYSPAIILFRSKDMTVEQFGKNPDNIIYPVDKEGNLVYACLKVPRCWILDSVEVFNAENLSAGKKRLTPDLDSGFVPATSKLGHAVVRRIEKYVEGHPVYQDTNNSSNDFYETDTFSLK